MKLSRVGCGGWNYDGFCRWLYQLGYAHRIPDKPISDLSGKAIGKNHRIATHKSCHHRKTTNRKRQTLQGWCSRPLIFFNPLFAGHLRDLVYHASTAESLLVVAHITAPSTSEPNIAQRLLTALQQSESSLMMIRCFIHSTLELK